MLSSEILACNDDELPVIRICLVKEFVKEMGFHFPGAGSGPVVCFLPGSRRQEIHRLLPTFQRAFTLLRKDWPSLTAVVVTVPGPVGDDVVADVATWGGTTVTCMPVTEQERYDAFAVR